MSKAKNQLINQQIPLSIHANEQLHWDNFCWNNNALLKAQLLEFITSPNENCLYVWGKYGSGKSHLLQATCQHLTTTHKQTALYLPLADLKEFGSQVVENLSEHDFIAVDDVHEIAGIAEWEEALFHLYNQVRDSSQGKIIFTSDNAPTDKRILLNDLRSRLAWGISIYINELSDEDKIVILQEKARDLGITLSLKTLNYLLNHCTRSLHGLQTILARLDRASLSAKRRITIPFIKASLSGEF